MHIFAYDQVSEDRSFIIIVGSTESAQVLFFFFIMSEGKEKKSELIKRGKVRKTPSVFFSFLTDHLF